MLQAAGVVKGTLDFYISGGVKNLGGENFSREIARNWIPSGWVLPPCYPTDLNNFFRKKFPLTLDPALTYTREIFRRTCDSQRQSLLTITATNFLGKLLASREACESERVIHIKLDPPRNTFSNSNFFFEGSGAARTSVLVFSLRNMGMTTPNFDSVLSSGLNAMFLIRQRMAV